MLIEDQDIFQTHFLGPLHILVKYMRPANRRQIVDVPGILPMYNRYMWASATFQVSIEQNFPKVITYEHRHITDMRRLELYTLHYNFTRKGGSIENTQIVNSRHFVWLANTICPCWFSLSLCTSSVHLERTASINCDVAPSRA